MRQQGDTVELLLRLRDAKATTSDWEYLMSRTPMHCTTSEFASAIHLYPTTEAVSEHNITRLKQNEQPIAHIKAVHHGL